MSTPVLHALLDAGAIDGLDLRFAQMIARRFVIDDDRVLVAAALANRAPTHGHVCVNLETATEMLQREVGTKPDADPDDQPDLPPLWPTEEWLAAVNYYTPIPPLVLEGASLYLERYWHYEESLVAAIRDRVTRPPAAVYDELLHRGLDRLFQEPPNDAQQHLAAQTAVRRGFTVIHGGPGTGKTTVVVKLLALLGEQAHATQSPQPRVAPPPPARPPPGSPSPSATTSTASPPTCRATSPP